MATYWRLNLVGMLVCGLLAGCGTEPPIPAEIRLGMSSVSLTAIGQTQQLDPKVLDEQGTILNDVAITWSSQNETVASVTNGLVKAEGAGSTSITATVGSASATVAVNVVQTVVGLRSVGGSGQSGAAGSVLPLPLTVQAIDANFKPVAGVEVEFLSPSDGAIFAEPTGVTDANGQASSPVMVRRAGPFSVFAAIVGTETFAEFRLTGNAAPASQLLIRNSSNFTVRPRATISHIALVVADAFGNGIPGVSVRFDVVAGGGIISPRIRDPLYSTFTDVSDENGVIAFHWRVGSSGEQRVTATAVDQQFAGSPISYTATVTDGFISPFDIALRFRSAITPSQAQAFGEAAEQWERHIVGDLSAHQVSLPGVCGPGTPEVDDAIDDLLIFVELIQMDGPGNALAVAGPCIIRTANDLPVAGLMYFDIDDIASLEADGLLRDVVRHEMGHVLGIGTLWETKNLLVGPAGAGGTDPRFIGTQAIAAFDAAGGITYVGRKVPVENTGGPSTADSHWRESILNNELMTGYVNVGTNPLSAITVRSLEDLGYTVDASGAEPFIVGQALRLPGRRAPIPLGNDAYRGPIRRIDSGGRLTH